MQLTPCIVGGLAILALSLWLPHAYGQQQGHGDYKKIRRNGSKDDLKERFHRNNAIRRGAVIATGTVIIGMLLEWLLNTGLGFFAAYGFYAACAFGWQFTTTLNCKRGLNKWYVSHDPRASKTDKAFIKGARNWNRFLVYVRRYCRISLGCLLATPPDFSRYLHTGFVVISFGVLALVVWINR